MREALEGMVVLLFGVGFFIHSIVRLLTVIRMEKRCTVCDGKFVEAEKTSIGYRYPKFSIKVEMEIGERKIRASTAGVYSASDISGLTAESVLRVGYDEKTQEVIIL